MKAASPNIPAHIAQSGHVAREARVIRGIEPEFVALPARGGDPVCGLSRSWWYAAERAGHIRLIRLRHPGKIRGRVLLPVRAAIEAVQKLSSQTDVRLAA